MFLQISDKTNVILCSAPFYLCISVPQLFCQQGTVSWKTIFSQTRGMWAMGSRCKGRWSFACSLPSTPSARPRSWQAMDHGPVGADPCSAWMECPLKGQSLEDGLCHAFQAMGNSLNFKQRQQNSRVKVKGMASIWSRLCPSLPPRSESGKRDCASYVSGWATDLDSRCLGVGMVQEAGGAQPRGVERRASVSTITVAQMSASAWRDPPWLRKPWQQAAVAGLKARGLGKTRPPRWGRAGNGGSACSKGSPHGCSLNGENHGGIYKLTIDLWDFSSKEQLQEMTAKSPGAGTSGSTFRFLLPHLQQEKKFSRVGVGPAVVTSNESSC